VPTTCAVRGGLRVLEITFTTPNADRALFEVRDRLPSGVLLGAGSVMTEVQAAQAFACGADFLVSPHLDPDLLSGARALGVPFLPGVLTPSEIVRARGLGEGTLKLFPAGACGGAAYVRDLLGPFPDLNVMVTGGITPQEVPAYLAAGALAVGLGSHLFPRAALRGGDWRAVEDATRAALLAALVPP